MNILVNGKPVTLAQLRRIGWAIINLSTQIEREEEQREQAERVPSPKEIDEARRATLRRRAAVRQYKSLVAKLGAPS